MSSEFWRGNRASVRKKHSCNRIMYLQYNICVRNFWMFQAFRSSTSSSSSNNNSGDNDGRIVAQVLVHRGKGAREDKGAKWKALSVFKRQ